MLSRRKAVIPDPTADHNEETAINTSRAGGSFNASEPRVAKTKAQMPVRRPWMSTILGMCKRIPT
jgi:hypothetical protein